ncbi:AN1-type zinc finger protein 5-like [Grus japonensis]|uniref:AN1-type zinc finger protein 5-like n=1 Tax=Grus japonensis TaxID=30415 RepID=A0ABC9X6V4_GRUJA
MEVHGGAGIHLQPMEVHGGAGIHLQPMEVHGGAGIHLQPMEVHGGADIHLQPVEVHGGADIHLQPVEDPMPEQVDAPEGGCDPRLEQGQRVRSPPPEEEGAAETPGDELTTTPIPRPAKQLVSSQVNPPTSKCLIPLKL